MKDDIKTLKNNILSALEDWHSNRINEYDLLEIAEGLLEEYGWRNFSKNEPESIIMEVLSQLEIMNHQLITRDDVPIIRSFIDKYEDPCFAWNLWKGYWESLDYKARKQALCDNEFYMIP